MFWLASIRLAGPLSAPFTQVEVLSKGTGTTTNIEDSYLLCLGSRPAKPEKASLGSEVSFILERSFGIFIRVSPFWNNGSNPSRWIPYISFVSRNNVDMQVKHSLPCFRAFIISYVISVWMVLLIDMPFYHH